MVELYHFWSSVCSVRCRMALEEKGVPWTSRYIDLFKFDQMKPEYLALNPDGVVPTLVHDGEPIRESTIINEYIDAAFAGPKLVPADALKAARMREFVHRCEESFDAIGTSCPSCETAGARRNSSSKPSGGRRGSIATSTAEAFAAKSPRRSLRRRAPRSRSCSTVWNATSIRGRGSSAKTTRSRKSPLRPTCSACRRWAPTSSGRTTEGRA
jgi:hypothetical protein